VRGEWFGDPDGARVPRFSNSKTDTNLGEFTFTGAYKFTKMLLGRIELRQDFADGNIFGVGDTSGRTNNPSNKSQTTFAMQLLYQF